MSTQAKFPPGPTTNLLWNKEANLRKDVLGYFQRSIRKYGGISRAMVGPYHYVNLSDPDYIERVFLNPDIYIKGRDNKNLRFLLGNGLVTSEGEFWLKQRRLIQPMFHKQRLQGFVQKISESTDKLISSMASRSGQVLDMHTQMTHVTLDIVSQTLMSTEVKGDFKTISDALHKVMEGMMKIIRLPKWIPTPLNLGMKRSRAILDETIFKIIEERRNSKETYNDLLTMLMEVEDADTRERMTDAQLRDELITIFLAGHETTANALAFTLYLLAQHPEIKQKVVDEVNRTIGTGEMTYENLMKLEYTTMVIKEGMRLYPPVWGITRDAAKEDVVGGYRVKKGDSIAMSPYAVHRFEKYWPEPLAFKPERFSPENIKSIHRYAWFPFGGGQRFCIGNNFAMMEMQIILAKVCTHYNFTLAPGFELELQPLVTLRPKNGVMLKVEKA
ncbi:MAG TPA: cytochrome P450 [Chitinophagales bacterium]|nr:cytochrome P450 [Chitinophagales bacterium]